MFTHINHDMFIQILCFFFFFFWLQIPTLEYIQSSFSKKKRKKEKQERVYIV